MLGIAHVPWACRSLTRDLLEQLKHNNYEVQLLNQHYQIKLEERYPDKPAIINSSLLMFCYMVLPTLRKCLGMCSSTLHTTTSCEQVF